MGFEINRLTILLFITSIIILCLSVFVYIKSWDESKLSGSSIFCGSNTNSQTENKCDNTTENLEEEELNLYQEIDGVVYGFRIINGEVVFGTMESDGFRANPDLHVLGKYVDKNVLDFWVDLENNQVYLLSSISPTYKSSPIALTRVNFKNIEYEYLDKNAKTKENLIVANEWDLISAFDDNEFILDTIVDFKDKKDLIIEGYLSDGCDLSGRMYRINVDGKSEILVEYGDGCNEKTRKLGYINGMLYLSDVEKCEEGYVPDTNNPYCVKNIFTIDPVTSKKSEIYKFDVLQYSPAKIDVEGDTSGMSFQKCMNDGSCLYSVFNIDDKKLIEVTNSEPVSDEVVLPNNNDDVTIQNTEELSTLGTPIIVKGMIDSSWLFEGKASAKLEDQSGNTVLEGELTELTPGSWTSEGKVDFVITFNNPQPIESAVLVINNDNPSGLPENDKEFRTLIGVGMNQEGDAPSEDSSQNQ